ncbi:ATP-binding protein [Aurantimonas sp. MSK8Z-1]|uniref:sensor histidine kinase n=1 Tax=Mangrovibrevibacter kandeliae TaxID=2968473 RepID=UPI0021198535|nr:sensor histidine kinase [Aurantimonas sp. MSK8Z-1]MCW4114079.1 ATP-binding protein [Aurantimonas sp. MSK8Z-1]
MTIVQKSFGRLVLGAVVVGFLALITASLAGGYLISRTRDHSGWVEHTYQVELGLARFTIQSERTEAAYRGLLEAEDPRLRQVFEANIQQLPATLDSLSALVADNPDQVIRLTRLHEVLNERMGLLRHLTDAGRNGNPPISSGERERSDALLQATRETTQEMARVERGLLAERDALQDESIRSSNAVLIGAGLLLVIVAAGTIWITMRNTRELTASRNALARLNENLEGAVRERTSDLQRANEEIQRFAYIVSHDLRSPLVNVMGFTSELSASLVPLQGLLDKVEAQAPGLASEDAATAVREDLPEAIGFIRSSTQKMDRLINAILRLSREGRRTITPERLDMDAMVAGIVDSLRHRLDEIGAEVRVETPLPNLVSDRLALEQIVSNLVENAVKYLKPGRPGRVVVRGRRTGERAVIEVEDNGRGIDPRDHERIFDLFRRSGTQDQPGEGIGLAHVRALAYRLGGIVGCDSELDRGAVFRLSLPLSFADHKDNAREPAPAG